MVKFLYRWYKYRPKTILLFLQYFNIFICFLTFGILSLPYQLTKTIQNANTF
jgi:hypothetical protein